MFRSPFISIARALLSISLKSLNSLLTKRPELIVLHVSSQDIRVLIYSPFRPHYRWLVERARQLAADKRTEKCAKLEDALTVIINVVGFDRFRRRAGKTSGDPCQAVREIKTNRQCPADERACLLFLALLLAFYGADSNLICLE